MTDTALEQRDDEAVVAEAITSGRSLRAVQKQFGLTAAELDAVLEKLWPLDLAARLRMIRGDVGKLDRLTETFYSKALAGDVQSGTLVVKIWERKHELLGLQAAQRIDLQIVSEPREAHEFDRVFASVMKLKYGPDWRPGDGNGGAGAVGALSDSG